VPAGELPFEFMLNALRLKDGFQLDEFTGATGLPADTVTHRLAELASRGLLDTEGGRYRPSSLGFRFLNDLIGAFLPEGNGRRTPGELYTAPSGVVSDNDFRHFVSEVR
jgi:oxygen-independent coproporphyrinogen-3 oxidase